MAFVGDSFVYRCWTLEDPVRPKGVKVAGDTAIPAGSYKVQIRHSSRFQKDLPGVQGVPGFDGILIHGGNDKEDTHGCLLVGTQLISPVPSPRIAKCAAAVEALMGLLRQYGQATLTIKDAV